jgi:hypothetical protein
MRTADPLLCDLLKFEERTNTKKREASNIFSTEKKLAKNATTCTMGWCVTVLHGTVEASTMSSPGQPKNCTISDYHYHPTVSVESERLILVGAM